VSEEPNEAGGNRLRDEDADVARLLRQASRGFREGEAEGPAFRRLERTRFGRAAFRVGLVAAGLCIAVVALQTRFSGSGDESWAVVEKEPLGALAVVEHAPAPAPVAVSARELASPAPKLAALPSSRPLPADEASCQRLSHAGELPAAVECYRSLARGDGVVAELGLYRAAKIELENRGRAAQALALLDEHQQRFAAGALRGEVDFLRIQALARAGRVDDALSESERLLGGPLGRALSADLHALRGRLFQDQKQDCARAIQEFVALLGVPGPRGEEAEFRRATCLEALGRAADAKAAYQQYLKRTDAVKRERAEERLKAFVGQGAESVAQ
jgi:tetratricopeptide (TPR) repeat protein